MTEPAPVVLAALALVLAGPVPALLARARWTGSVPRAALVLWQALALAAVLAAVGAGLSAGSLVVSAARPGPLLIVLHAGALVLTCVVVARLLLSAHSMGTRLRTRRRRHRAVVDLVGRPHPRAPGAHVVQAAPGSALVYCIPGLRSRVVVTSPVLDVLDDDELRAALDHERSHVRARHDLVLEAFTVLHDAFPRWVRSRAALDATAGLVEMLADDAARSRNGAVPLARALATLAGSAAPAGTLGSTGPATTTLARVRRLAEPPRASSRALAAAAYSAALALVVVPTVTVAVPWLDRLLPVLTG